MNLKSESEIGIRYLNLVLWIYFKQLAFKQNILDEMQVHKETTGISCIKHGNIIFIMLNQTNRRTLHIMTF